MAAQGSAGRSGVGWIAGGIVVVILAVGGYFALSDRFEPKPEQTIAVAVVPPAGEAAKPDAPAADAAPASTAETTAPAATMPPAAATTPSTDAAPSTAAAPAATPAAPSANAPPASGQAPSATAAAPQPSTAPATAEEALQAAAPPSAPDAPAAARSGEAAAPSAAGQPQAPSTETAAAPAMPSGTTDAAPAAPAPGTPVAPSFDVVRVEPRGDAVVAGRAEPNATVEILDGSTPIAKGKANEQGEWALTADQPLAPGSHDLSIRTTSPDGRTESLSEQSVAISVPANPRAGPLVVLNNPEGASTVLQVPASEQAGGAGAARPDVTVDAVEFQNGKLYISGSAAIGGTVRVYVDGVVIGDATVNADGRWTIASDRPVSPGQHTVRADGIDKTTGTVVARAEVPFEQNGDVATLLGVDTAGGGSAGAESANKLPLQSVMIQRGDNLWTISKRLYGHGVRFSTIYEANNDQIRDPDLIYPGQVFVLPVGDTRWQERAPIPN